MYYRVIIIILLLIIAGIYMMCRSSYVVSMTTIPSRIHEINKTINSLKNQEPAPEHIIINIPKKYERFETGITDIPNFLRDDPMIKINLIETDYGPATKMLGILNLDIPGNTIVLICDDDTIYKQGWALTLIDNIRKYRDCVFAINRKSHRTPIIFGHDGWGFYRGLINADDILNSYYKNKEFCNLVDDEFFTNYFKENIRAHKRGKEYTERIKLLTTRDALHKLSGSNERSVLQKSCNSQFSP